MYICSHWTPHNCDGLLLPQGHTKYGNPLSIPLRVGGLFLHLSARFRDFWDALAWDALLCVRSSMSTVATSWVLFRRPLRILGCPFVYGGMSMLRFEYSWDTLSESQTWDALLYVEACLLFLLVRRNKGCCDFEGLQRPLKWIEPATHTRAKTTCMRVLVHICMYIYKYAYAYLHKYEYMHIYIYIHICMCVTYERIYIHLYIYVYGCTYVSQ